MLTTRRHRSHNQAEAENLRRLAFEKVLRALAKRQAYTTSGAYKPHQRIRLEQAVDVAMEEFIAKLAMPH